MPTYDYQCQACGHEFEQFQSITAKPLRKCPECGKLKLKRLIGTGAAVIFKGSGFWQTDYRSESYKKAAKADAEPSATGDSTKTDKTAGAKDAAPKADAAPKSDSPKSDSAPSKPAAEHSKPSSSKNARKKD